MMRRRRVTLITAGALVAAIAITWGALVAFSRDEPIDDSATQSAPPSPTTETTPAEPAAPEPAQFDVDSADSLTVVVNKRRPLVPEGWQPADLVLPEGIPNNWGDQLRAPAADALQELYAASEAAGVPFIITSGYRDFERQAGLFDGYAATDGIEAAEKYSARPGFSEHQTGLAVDLTDGGECTLEECFGETATGLWLRENAWQYGFILRYELGEEAIVGYSYEPWHFRFVGVEVSTAMHEGAITNLEDFLGLPAAPDYGG